MLTYNRDAELAKALERLYRCPYLNKVREGYCIGVFGVWGYGSCEIRLDLKVIVVWNNVDRKPAEVWPRLHVPVE